MALFATHNSSEFHIGDLVRVYQKIQEDQKIRTQVFEGMVIAVRGIGPNKSFTVRRIGAGGIGVERIFPLASPLIEKVEVRAKGRVRRAKLYYIRTKTSRELADITKKKSVQSRPASRGESDRDRSQTKLRSDRSKRKARKK